MKKISLIIIAFASMLMVEACNPSAGDSAKRGNDNNSGKSDEPSLDHQDSTRIKNAAPEGKMQ